MTAVLSSIIDVLIYENKKDKVKFDLRNGNLGIEKYMRVLTEGVMIRSW